MKYMSRKFYKGTGVVRANFLLYLKSLSGHHKELNAARRMMSPTLQPTVEIKSLNSAWVATGDSHYEGIALSILCHGGTCRWIPY
jgi:hypothetical protein